MNRVLGNLFGRIFLTLRGQSIPRLGQKAHAQLEFSPFPTGLHVCVEACSLSHRVVAHRRPRFLGHQGFTQAIGMRQCPCLRPGQALPTASQRVNTGLFSHAGRSVLSQSPPPTGFSATPAPPQKSRGSPPPPAAWRIRTGPPKGLPARPNRPPTSAGSRPEIRARKCRR